MKRPPRLPATATQPRSANLREWFSRHGDFRMFESGATGSRTGGSMSEAQLQMRAGESADLVLRGATVLDPVAEIDAHHDIVVRDGAIAELAAPGEASADGLDEIDAE